MAHFLTESATFTAQVRVPDGTDPGTARAADVAFMAQSLANRTRALKVVTDVAAVKNAPNTFTAVNTFNASTTFAAVTASGLTISGSGVIAAADGTVNISGNATVAGAITGASVHTPGPIQITAAGGDIVLTPTAIRWVNIPLHTGRGITANANYDTLFDTWGVTGVTGPATIRFPVHGFPRAAIAIAAEAVWRAHDVAAANSLTLFGNTQDAWSESSGVLSDPVDPASIFAATQAGGFSTTQCTKSFTFVLMPYDVNNETTAFYVDVVLPDGPNNRLFALRYGYVDPGARNG